MAKAPSLTWRRQKAWTGPMGKIQAELGWELYYGKDLLVANVYPFHKGVYPEGGYYWRCERNEELGIGRKHTSRFPTVTMDEAKEQAIAYVRACLERMKDAEGESHNL